MAFIKSAIISPLQSVLTDLRDRICQETLRGVWYYCSDEQWSGSNSFLTWPVSRITLISPEKKICKVVISCSSPGTPRPTNSKLGVRLIRAAWLADAKIHINCPTSMIESYRYGVRCTSKPNAAPTPNNESIRPNDFVCELDMSKKTLIGKEISTVPLKRGHSDVATREESHGCIAVVIRSLFASLYSCFNSAFLSFEFILESSAGRIVRKPLGQAPANRIKITWVYNAPWWIIFPTHVPSSFTQSNANLSLK